MNPVFNKLVSESGRMILFTPPGTSGYVQACDDLINAIIQKFFNIHSTNWLVDKVMQLHQSGNAGTVANPSLEDICQIMAKVLCHLTPAAQRRSFEHCLLTLPTDGSLDKERGSKAIVELLEKYGETLVPTSQNSIELFPLDRHCEPSLEGRSASNDDEVTMSGIWEKLISQTDPEHTEDFQYPMKQRRPNIPR